MNKSSDRFQATDTIFQENVQIHSFEDADCLRDDRTMRNLREEASVTKRVCNMNLPSNTLEKHS